MHETKAGKFGVPALLIEAEYEKTIVQASFLYQLLTTEDGSMHAEEYLRLSVKDPPSG